MSFFEFPHTRTYDSDLGWLIREMRRLMQEVNDFDGRIGTETAAAVDAWITAHPEYVTTVEDGAISLRKLANDVLTCLQLRTLYVSMFSGVDDTECLQNAIDAALEMESCTLIIDRTLEITRPVQIIFTWSNVQALTIQGLEYNVHSKANVFHGDANPTLRDNMVGVIKCNVYGDDPVFNVVNRNDTNSLVVRGVIFFNSSEYTGGVPNGPVFANNQMTLFNMDGCVPRFWNCTMVGFYYSIYSPARTSHGEDNWTGDYAQLIGNTFYNCGYGIVLRHADGALIQGNGFYGLYGYKQHLAIEASHGVTFMENSTGAYMSTVQTDGGYGFIFRASVAAIIGCHGENSWFSYTFGILDSGKATFIGNQFTTTRKEGGKILVATGTAEVFLEGNEFDTEPYKGASAVINKDRSALWDYGYISTVADWDTYSSNGSWYFNNCDTGVTPRPGYVRGFLTAKFNPEGTLGTQEIVWVDGYVSRRQMTYGTWSAWKLFTPTA